MVPTGLERRADSRNFGFLYTLARNLVKSLRASVRRFGKRIRKLVGSVSKRAVATLIAAEMAVMRPRLSRWTRSVVQTISRNYQLDEPQRRFGQDEPPMLEALLERVANGTGDERLAERWAWDRTRRMQRAVTRALVDENDPVGYIWVRTTSAHPREKHLERVDEFFTFGEVEDEPGVLPGCKCTMEFVWRS